MNTFRNQLSQSAWLAFVDRNNGGGADDTVADRFLVGLQRRGNEDNVVAVVYREARDGKDYLTVFVNTMPTAQEMRTIEATAMVTVPRDDDRIEGPARDFDPLSSHHKVAVVVIDSARYATGEHVEDPGLLLLLAEIHEERSQAFRRKSYAEAKRAKDLKARAARGGEWDGGGV